MNCQYINTYPGKGKIAILVIGTITLLVGLLSHYASHWKTINETNNGKDDIAKWHADGKDIPSYSMEEYFVYMIIICFTLSLVSFLVSVTIDTTRGRKKLADFGYHILAACLLLIAGAVYISSANRIEKLNLYWKDGSEMKLCLGTKIFAGSLAILEGILYVIEAIFIWRGEKRIQRPSDDAYSKDRYRLTRNGVINPKARWKKFYIFVDPEFNDTERVLIKTTMSEMQEMLPCVQFRMWPKGESPSGFNESYVHVTKSEHGCSSPVGRRSARGSQKLELDPKCETKYTIIHEMLHALGFHHEQSRPDRDKYITINWQNIKRGKESNFRKYDYKSVSAFGVPYNPNSIMHYSSKAFSANGDPTILTKDGEIIDKPTTLQQSDVIKLKRMYKC
ncbi:Zinc metalloproteinase nas-7 [Orchesella cincta]|uniref:Metalloendopeptidase n=1 Tax=Orchesella cincta TaxID=48709 RepID=A0A1D2MU01_ORCCI|nr:Zinc metalloproteinase nas-7 [Orchesella cincta]